ncbi:MAG: hypothetical protein C0507_17175 [Cyanobacteria bacterium PR.3.49]|nr:hypothetical protein [Cyanobacteria bacterium PR.3.49]
MIDQLLKSLSIESKAEDNATTEDGVVSNAIVKVKPLLLSFTLLLPRANLQRHSVCQGSKVEELNSLRVM